MLVDKVRADFRAGTGGNGCVHFAINGKPNGGDGGKGGDVYLVGDENIYDLKNFRQKKFIAADGQPGASNNRKGAEGENLNIKVPLVTKIYDLESNLLAEVTTHGQKLLVAKGGMGGLGNYYFRRGQLATLKKSTPGKAGDNLQVFLELELLADVIFIGLPNAGKSSMLNALTNANVKVADYPFTTLVPYLGFVNGIRLMDLPGLIEGTSKGKGLGSNFSKHTKSAKAVAHFLSLDETSLEQSYKLIRKELVAIDEALAEKSELLVLTKSDNYSDKELEAKLKQAKKFHDNVIAVSVIDDDSLDRLTNMFKILTN